jgi:YkoY family integral membrane protein
LHVSLDLSAILLIVQLVYLEGILSIDNAAVLGAMVAHLPEHAPIPWPPWLRFVGRLLDPILRGQRPGALKVGLLGAYVGRGAMLFLAAWVVRNRWLLLVGGLYLIYLGIGHFGSKAEAAEDEARGYVATRRLLSFWPVVLNLELADLAFSLDNVVAAVALSREMWVVLTGVFLGIITMRFAAGLFVRLIRAEPMLEHAAYLLVLAIGLELLAEELFGVHITHAGKFLISIGIIGTTVLYARVPVLRALGAQMRWLRRILATLNAAIRIALSPIAWSIGLVARALGNIFGAIVRRPS